MDPYNSNILARLDYKSCFVFQMTPVFTKRWKDAGYAILVSLCKSHYLGHLLTDLWKGIHLSLLGPQGGLRRCCVCSVWAPRCTSGLRRSQEALLRRHPAENGEQPPCPLARVGLPPQRNTMQRSKTTSQRSHTFQDLHGIEEKILSKKRQGTNVYLICSYLHKKGWKKYVNNPWSDFTRRIASWESNQDLGRKRFFSL